MSWQEALAHAFPDAAQLLHTAHLALAPEPRNVSVARRFVAEHAADLPEDIRDDLVLVASELVTNGVVHARTPLELVLAFTAEEVAVGVHDLDLGRSEVGGLERDGGRGLALVADLSAERGISQHTGGGKTSWARLPLKGAFA